MRHIKLFKFHKVLALLASFSLLLMAVPGDTFAYIIAKTPSFINTFLSGLDPSGDLIISKEVRHPFGNGYTLPAGLSFDFTVSLGSEYAGKTVETSLGELTGDENGSIAVTVEPDSAVRIKNLANETSVTVTETVITGFIPNGGAQKSITIQNGENHLFYTNVYTPSPVSPVNLTVSGTKLLEGRDWQNGDSFTFQLEYRLAGEDDAWKKLGETSVTCEPVEVTDSETGEITWEPKPDFDKFDFTEMVQGITYNAAGEYSFRVSEVAGTIPGVTYDKIVSYFDVIVDDTDMDGALEIQNVKGYQNASASYDETTGRYHVAVTVNNKYAPDGTATAMIKIDKQVMSLSGEEKFPAGYTFELYDESGSLVAASGETSAAGETAIELTYGAKDAGETFHYTVKETHGGETHNGLIYADTVYPITVSIVDNLDGTISAYVYNTEEYQTELIEVEPEGTEKVDDEENAVVPENNVVVETDSPVMESSEPETKEVAVIPEGASNIYTVSFVNVYDPVDTSAYFGGTKKLFGRDLKEGEFVFDLYDTGESFIVAEEQKPIQTVTNDADGAFGFAPIAYNKVGIYRYVVKENSSAKLGGVTYDASMFRAIITVTDENGALKAHTSITDELGTAAEIEFQNSYKASAASISLSGTKTLTGMELAANMFQFHLYKADANYTIQGAALDGVSNDASGQFTFDRMEYAEPGTFYYVVKEDASAGTEGMTYDDTVYGIKVSVWDDGSGTLKASVALTVVEGSEVDTILFENSYTKPIVPVDSSDSVDPTKPSAPAESDAPPTGDDKPVELYIALAVTSIVALVFLLTAGKKKIKGRYLRD